MATNAAWVSAFQALTVTGVTRHYDEPPAAVSTADLPAAYLRQPGGDLPGLTISCKSSNKTRSIEYVLLVEPVGQGTQSQNFGALAALMDALETALDALTVSNFIEYDIEAGALVDVAGIQYWSIVANVRGRDV